RPRPDGSGGTDDLQIFDSWDRADPSMSPVKRLGVLGGTFSPIHFGHLSLADQLSKALKLDEVLFMPAFIPPLKKDLEVLPPEHRVAMVELGVQAYPKFRVSRLEIDAKGVSYTVHTLRRLREELPAGTELFFLAGTDVLRSLDRWYRREEVLSLAQFVVGIRPGFEAEPIPSGVRLVEIEAKRVSSTEIRTRIAKGESTETLIPQVVRDYIDRNGFYR
ncbi:MAG: nicotinate-nucleotide adenylyltransferase, partial [Candidatus Omnitrophica bacterium]|nr:nicotinate-nucleotide adenylyltransferase [Candidatus Omnitrophota bacterium]